MSQPVVPGFLGPQAQRTLEQLWARPSGTHDALWPTQRLRTVNPSPTDWVTVEEHYSSDQEDDEVHCVLVPAINAPAALETDGWIGRHVGEVNVWADGRYEEGLREVDRDVPAEFFTQVRSARGAELPVAEIRQPFLWYWDAYPSRDGWCYVNRAGREQELVRVELEATPHNYRIEMRALELRQWLTACGRTAVVQLSVASMAELPPFERVDDEFRNEWAHFGFYAVDGPVLTDRPFSRLVGQYLLEGQRNDRVPYWEDRTEKPDYPSFIYGIDEATGKPLTHTCDPEKLGTYFDKDSSRLHYLTPIYFSREVLQPYQAEPRRYRISGHSLSCLDLWVLHIGFNSAGLVEVYLGDIGRSLPPEEWGHWSTYNVLPQGHMDEGRFRRDFLAQIASSRDLPGDLRRARAEAAEASQLMLGAPVWKPLSGDIKAEFDSLLGPLTNDPSALGASLLTLTKALVDAIDPKPLKEYLKTWDPGDQSLKLLGRFAEELGDTEDLVEPLRNLQAFRSSGGVAHLAGSKQRTVATALGIAGMPNAQAFELVATRLTVCLRGLTALIVGASSSSSGKPTS